MGGEWLHRYLQAIIADTKALGGGNGANAIVLPIASLSQNTQARVVFITVTMFTAVASQIAIVGCYRPEFNSLVQPLQEKEWQSNMCLPMDQYGT
ncbi:hypothetical protein RvY_00053-2 [Ramazzottius varieornatus]|uniref:Uncharacterized protein n=1 Tax=Ramazzottius varieornatus TaxID=947166 RepID=A0A1D1UF48_RAMVA|nr:hypothetical protein RvY_00053-2 [Ramazzottius varieornatus]